jgi:hypothetical protein
MTTLAGPHPVLEQTATTTRGRAKSDAAESGQAQRRRAHHLRNEILGVIAFAIVLAVVFMMRNYAS